MNIAYKLFLMHASATMAALNFTWPKRNSLSAIGQRAAFLVAYDRKASELHKRYVR